MKKAMVDNHRPFSPKMSCQHVRGSQSHPEGISRTRDKGLIRLLQMPPVLGFLWGIQYLLSVIGRNSGYTSCHSYQYITHIVSHRRLFNANTNHTIPYHTTPTPLLLSNSTFSIPKAIHRGEERRAGRVHSNVQMQSLIFPDLRHS